MTLTERINLLTKLGEYLKSNDEDWLQKKQQAQLVNPWFIETFIDEAANQIVNQFLQKDLLINWANQYKIDSKSNPKIVGLVMAGNIPLVGFHDFLCVFVSGHKQKIKPSSKDEILIKHLADKLIEWDKRCEYYIEFAERLNNCDAYIATGSTNSARYFEYYFSKKPSIIRRNRTSVAILSGRETADELNLLSDDVHLYFGLGCRNVTKIYVPEHYDFVPLLHAFKKYAYFFDHSKYRHNYDYQLAIQMMNNVKYMTNDSIILLENESLFSPISVLHFSFYKNGNDLNILQQNDALQCIIGLNNLPFGKSQQPFINTYADGVDTMDFLSKL